VSIFDSQLNRGRFLIVVFVLVIAGVLVLNGWGAGAADKEARRRTAQIEAALRGHTPADLQPALLAQAYSATAPGLPGGPYRSVGPLQGGGLGATLEIRKVLQSRCIRVALAVDGALTVRTSHRGC
jgi:hypothetical protein